MNVIEYLKEKYSVDKPTTMTTAEWKIFTNNAKPVLQTGWLKKYGNLEITPKMKQQLKSALHKKTKSRYKTSAKYAHQGLLTIHNGSADKQNVKFAFIASDSFLSSYEWRKIRMEALKKYGSKCQCCGASPSTGAVMNVDHIKPRKLFPSLALCLDNLQVLCHECNHGKGNWDMTDWRTDDYYIKLPHI